ncbi:hypothetical protein BKA70DRAFT_1540486 [Coprinopsis sp. MPI-PUGE-AT-0042]|nr:hypothetical protein BKA70DRAFT_1540486 [Coprinopsis sp. MPI-PUGE-AT-0042]
MTPVDLVVALWSCVTSLCLLLRRNPAQAFSFKYYKDRKALVGKEDPNGRLEFEFTDFTNDVPRRLELSTLKGVGRLVYRAGRQALALTKKCMGPIEAPEDTLIQLPVIQRHLPPQVSSPASHSPTRHCGQVVITTGWENRAGWRVYPSAGRVRVAVWAPHQKPGPAGAGLVQK